MSKQVVKPGTVWIANSTTPRADQSYKNGNRPIGGNLPKYSEATKFVTATAGGGGDGTLVGLLVGDLIPVQVRLVKSTGTTATNIVALG